MDQNKIRNIAIIAHVDHGKTTLVDHMLKQAHVFESFQAEMQQQTILDSNDLERERGVTILAKNTAIKWKDYKINILDTPGHADFSGEVERVLNMADGCILLVDASEGVLSQTRYVLNLALRLKLKIIVLVNKVDRKNQRTNEVIEEINDLFLELADDESQLDFPILYGIGKDGIVGKIIHENPDQSLSITDSQNLDILFEHIINEIPAPNVNSDGPFQMQVTTLDYDSHKGRYVIGKIVRGKIKLHDPLAVMQKNMNIAQSRVEYLYTFYGLKKEEITEAESGDIIAITGFPIAKIGDTLCSLDAQESLPDLMLSEPTIKIQLSVSTSPFSGEDGEYTTSRQIAQRLKKELETNVGLKIADGPTGESFELSGRGELHLSILFETMRREGFEFDVARPQVIFKEIDGVMCEPWELVSIEVPEEYVGVVINEMGERKADMKNMKNMKNGVRIDYKIATRNLIGFRTEFLTLTSGMGIINSTLLGYEPKGEKAQFQRNGALVSAETGQALAYSLENLQKRGTSFIDPGEKVYAGMIIGLNSKKEDIVMNVCKGKKLTNMRAAAADTTIKITPATKMSLEKCLNFLGPDELLEITPKHLRLHKKTLVFKKR
ncbi:translational GTPase TypA [Candidatus Beckwithbacteria bacterium]|nr:translational GTPase TypA [Candidatus Beckwithbacteria bacterium]